MSKSSANKPATPAPKEAKEHDDDLIITPRGTSRFQFLFILGLMIFTLIIFTVGDSLQSSVATGPGGSETGMTWQHPERGEQSLDGRAFLAVKRELDDFYRVQGSRRVRLEDGDVAVFVVTNQLAKDAGIEITDQEVARAILQGAGRLAGAEPSLWSMFPLGDAQTYEALRTRAEVSALRFEQTLRDVLRVDRYMTLIAAAASYPDPEDVLAAWKEEHQEHAYDYVELRVEEFRDEAADRVPSSEELEAWYDALPNKNQLFSEEMRQERLAAELIGLLVEGPEDAAGLLERFPPPADLEPEELAQRYYDQVRTTRFRRPEPLDELPETEDGTEPDPSDRIYATLDEVRDVALREAPIHTALVAWLADISSRAQMGEELDLLGEAAELGLFYTSDGLAREHQAWVELEGLGSNQLANAVRAAGFQPASLSATVSAGPTGLFVARVTDKVPAGPPPMADIEERVVEEWIERHAAELALERLEALYAALAAEAGVTLPEDWADGDEDEGPPSAEEPDAVVVVDEETFARVAEEAGYTVGRRDWMRGFRTEVITFGQGQSFEIPVSPSPFDPHAERPANAFLNAVGQQRLEAFEAGRVAQPALDGAGEHAFLVRKVGERVPEEIRLPRAEFDAVRAEEAERRRLEFQERYFSAAAYAERYGVEGYWQDDPEADADTTDPE